MQIRRKEQLPPKDSATEGLDASFTTTFFWLLSCYFSVLFWLRCQTRLLFFGKYVISYICSMEQNKLASTEKRTPFWKQWVDSNRGEWKEFVLLYPIFLKTPPFFISVIRLFYQFCFFSFPFKNYCCSVPSPGSSASFLLRSVLAFTFGPLSNHLIKANFHDSCLTMSSCAKRQTSCEFRKFKM